MLRQFHTVIYTVTVADFLLFAGFLLFTRRNRHISNQVFAFFLLSQAIAIGSFLLIENLSRSLVVLPLILYIAGSCMFLKGPMLYFYARSLTDRRLHPRRRDTVHLIPFAVYAVYAVLLLCIHSGDASSDPFRHHLRPASLDWQLVNGALNALILGYLIASFRLLKRYVASLRNTFSSLDRISLPWLKFILYGFTALWALWTANYLFAVFASRFLIWLDLAAMVVFFITANVTVFNGLCLPELFAGIEVKPKYKDSPLTGEEKRRYAGKILDYMAREKPYRNPALALNDLAEALAIVPRHFSQVINEHFGQNFYDFVNSYRIEEAKRHLTDSTRNLTVLEILYEVGFNSKSAFNLAFKTQTGLTPTEFRRNPSASV